MNDSTVTYVVTVTVEMDTNGTYYAYCPGIKGIHVSGFTRKEAIDEVFKSVVNRIEISYNRKEKMPENEYFYILRGLKPVVDLEEDDVLMPIPAHMASALLNCEQGL